MKLDKVTIFGMVIAGLGMITAIIAKDYALVLAWVVIVLQDLNALRSKKVIQMLSEDIARLRSKDV